MDNPISIREDNRIYFCKATTMSTLYGINVHKVDVLLEDMEQCHVQAIERDVDELFREIYACGADYHLVKMYRDYLQLRLLRLAEEPEYILSKKEVLEFISTHDFSPQSMKRSRSEFKQFAVEFAEYRMQYMGKDMAGLLAQIEKDIRNNYMEDISLKSLSAKYFISRPYLGQIFRKQFGISFKDFLNNVRIENAEKLLIQTDEKIYNIAAMVGYNNSDYFINKFTAAKGATPAKFRKMLHNAEQE